MPIYLGSIIIKHDAHLNQAARFSEKGYSLTGSIKVFEYLRGLLLISQGFGI